MARNGPKCPNKANFGRKSNRAPGAQESPRRCLHEHCWSIVRALFEQQCSSIFPNSAPRPAPRPARSNLASCSKTFREVRLAAGQHFSACGKLIRELDLWEPGTVLENCSTDAETKKRRGAMFGQFPGAGVANRCPKDDRRSTPPPPDRAAGKSLGKNSKRLEHCARGGSSKHRWQTATRLGQVLANFGPIQASVGQKAKTDRH